MVLCNNHFHTSNMYPSSNRHPSHQGFGLPSYGYPGQQATQYGPPTNMSEMGCAVAQYQMPGLGNISDSIQHSASQSMAMTSSWPYAMSSCNRGSVFEDWTGHAQGQLPPSPMSTSPCTHGPFSLSSAVSHHAAASSPSCNFGYKLNGPPSVPGTITPSPTPLGSSSSAAVIHHHSLHANTSASNPNSDPSHGNSANNNSSANGSTGSGGHGTGSSGVNSASGNSDQEYSNQVHVQDLTHASGNHSPDSGLTVSSDGVSSSDSPQHIPAFASQKSLRMDETDQTVISKSAAT
ncbi:hypothetical protein CHUAL_012864, partial [Chamberlinius hualienensis]